MDQEVKNQQGNVECLSRMSNPVVNETLVRSKNGESVSGEDGEVYEVKENEFELQNQEGTHECLSEPINPDETETTIVVRSIEGESASGGAFETQNYQQGTSECSSRPNNPVVTETVILVRSEEGESVGGEDGGVCKVKDNAAAEMSKVSIDKRKAKVSQPEKHTCAINIRCKSGRMEGESKDGENVCRICHLSGDHLSETLDLIRLGCSCKDDLGIAHSHCAEAWFKLKGNRCCEICGEAAKNITGVWDNRFMEEWNDRRFDGTSGGASDRRWGFWRGQPFCNFLMACLVMAFVLPWFFRVNMF